MDPNRFRSSSVYHMYQRFFGYNSNQLFEMFENSLFAYADESTLLAVVPKPADGPAVASLNGDLARVQEWCNHWRMILIPNKTKALVVSRSRTLNPPHCD